VDPTRTESLAAAAVNGYLQVADAHARIVPGPPAGAAPDLPRGGRAQSGARDTYTGIGFTVQGLGDQVRTLLVTRERLAVRSVHAESFVDRGWGLVYLRIADFLGADTCRRVERSLRERLGPNVNALILDLRDNSGGLIDQAVCVADLLLPRGLTVTTMRETRSEGAARPFVTRQPQRVSVRLVTVVNAVTASASELLAGALQDHGRSLLIGERTFGKGTVQTVRAWSYRPTVLEFFTAARYYRPSGRALREEDLFPTALPEDPAASPPPAPPAAGLEEAIGCVGEYGLAGRRFARERAQGRTSDYHLLVAQELLVCGLGRAR